MPDLLKLPLRVASLATLPARYALQTAWGLLNHDADDGGAARPAAATAQAPAPVVEEPAEKPPPRSKARAPRKRAAASPKAARRAVRHEPTKGQAAAIREREREAEQNAGGPGPGPAIDVAPPWEDYDALGEEQVLDRLTGADSATRAAVRLYEGLHANRQQVIFATEQPVSE